MQISIITCNATHSITKAQRYLLDKYVLGEAPDMFNVAYHHLYDEPVNNWTSNVFSKLSWIRNKYIILGLNDFLPTAPINMHRFIDALRS